MSERYVGKVVSVSDEYTVVINLGYEKGVKAGDKFLIVGLGDIIVDPDTQENLGQLEIVRGKASVTHVQDKMATIESCEYEKTPDKKEIKKTTSSPRSTYSVGMSHIFGNQDSITETITPGQPLLKALIDVKVGDCLIKINN